jgi:hypothetical protein
VTTALWGLVERLDGAPVAVSRATAAPDRAVIASGSPVVVLPVTGGLTVWELAPADVVPIVITPNHLGITDRLPAGSGWVGIRRSSWIDGHGQLDDDIDPATVPIRQIRRLATRLTTVAGTTRYHGEVDARWFTLLASDPAVLERPHPKVDAIRLGREFVDVPGGVRIEVAPDATESDLAGYAAAVERAAAERVSP